MRQFAVLKHEVVNAEKSQKWKINSTKVANYAKLLLAARLMSIIRKVVVYDGEIDVPMKRLSEHVYFLGICIKATLYKYEINGRYLTSSEIEGLQNNQQ